jgi:hypothetical protein
VAIEELFASGCRAAGYRLAGAVLDHVCCRHLYADDRMLTAWPAIDRVVVLVVGPHDRSATDVYDILLGALEIEVPEEERAKPACCEPEQPPPTDADLAIRMADAIEAASKRPASRATQQ